MRAWLLLRMLEVPFDELTVPLYQAQSRSAVRALGGQTGLVPVLLDGAAAIWDTMAIFEHFQELHPAVWPVARLDRAHARSISGEIHSGFHALRSAMPVNTRARNRIVARSTGVENDIERIKEILKSRSCGAPWLFGSFCGADIMLAPIATRFQTYGVQLEGAADVYMNQLLGHPLVAEWLRLGEAEKDVIGSLEVGIAD